MFNNDNNTNNNHHHNHHNNDDYDDNKTFFFFINAFQVTQEQITEPVTTVNTLKKTMIIQF